MSKYAKSALEVLAATIREIERKAAQAVQERDRLLAKAREAAQERSDLEIQATNLREILSGADSRYYATYVSMFGEPFDPNADPAREELIAGYRDAIAFVEATPELPFTASYVGINDENLRDAGNLERRAQAERMAALLGVEVTSYTNYRDRPQLNVSRMFGPVSLAMIVELDPEPDPDPGVAVGEADQASGEALDEGVTGMGDAVAGAL